MFRCEYYYLPFWNKLCRQVHMSILYKTFQYVFINFIERCLSLNSWWNSYCAGEVVPECGSHERKNCGEQSYSRSCERSLFGDRKGCSFERRKDYPSSLNLIHFEARTDRN